MMRCSRFLRWEGAGWWRCWGAGGAVGLDRALEDRHTALPPQTGLEEQHCEHGRTIEND